MNFCKFISIIFISAIIFSGCKSSAKKTNETSSDSTGYTIPAQAPISPEEYKLYHDGIEDYYKNKLVKYGFNGAVLVAKRGHIIFEGYHGFFNLQKKDSLNAHSAFHLASVSKTFTAMATLRLEEEGKLSIDDSISKYFPALPYKGITIKMLLNHRSGLPNYIHFMENLGWNKKQFCSNEDVLDYLIKYHPLGTGRPDTHFSYCNTNYCLLALIIEKASGQPYADYLKQTFFKPLHMDDTYVFSMATDSAKAMPSYDYRGRPEAVTFLDANYGDKNVYSTPRDMLKWDQALYSNQLFSKATMEKAFTPYSNEKPGVRNYGLGWRMNIFPDGQKVIYHNGWWHGNNTVFIRMIQDSVTIIVLGNKFNKNIYQSKKMADIFGSGLKIEDE